MVPFENGHHALSNMAATAAILKMASGRKVKNA